MPDSKKKHQINNDASENIDSIDFSSENIQDLLSNIDIEKVNNLIQTFSPKIKKQNGKIEVLNMLKELLPDDKNEILDIFISILGGNK